eukprot:symbB.v1.2.019480.t1/scaffold1594.1/size109923/2
MLEEAPVLSEEDDVAARARARELAVSRVNRARAQLGAGDALKAEQDALQASNLDPTYGRAKTVLAEAYQKQGRTKDAEALLTVSTQAGPQLTRLPALLNSASWRALGTYALLVLLLLGIVALHHRLAMDALHGRQPVLGHEELREVLRYTSGYGVASFPARIRPEQVEDAARSMKIASAQEWSVFIKQAFGRQAQNEEGKLLLFSWGSMPKQGKGGKADPSSWIGMLAFVPKTAHPAALVQLLPERAAFGRLKRLGHSARSWLQSHFGLGSAAGGLLPLALYVQGTVADEQRLPSQLTFARLALLLVAAIALAISYGIYVAVMSLRDFERHPAMAELSDPSGRFIKGLEKDLNEDAPELKPRVLEDGKIIVTMNWFVHLPGNFSFFSRLFQPLLMLTNLVGVGSNGSGDVKAPSVGGLLQRCFQVLGLIPSWFHLLRRSLPGAVQVSPLWEVQLGFRSDQGTPPRGQIILWDASRGHFADVVGDYKAMEKLGREIATRQAIATKLITSAAISETGGIQKAEGGLDPRSMSLDRCYEVLKLSRDDARAAQSTSKEEAKACLARAFRLRVMEDPEAEKRKVEELGLALDVLMRRISLSLEM